MKASLFFIFVDGIMFKPYLLFTPLTGLVCPGNAVSKDVALSNLTCMKIIVAMYHPHMIAAAELAELPAQQSKKRVRVRRSRKSVSKRVVSWNELKEAVR